MMSPASFHIPGAVFNPFFEGSPVPSAPAPESDDGAKVYSGSCVQAPVDDDPVRFTGHPHVSDGACASAKSVVLQSVLFMAFVGQAAASRRDGVRAYKAAQPTGPELPAIKHLSALMRRTGSDQARPIPVGPDWVHMLPPSTHTLGNVSSVRELFRDLRWAGFDRFIVAGPEDPEVFTHVAQGAMAVGGMRFMADTALPVPKASDRDDAISNFDRLNFDDPKAAGRGLVTFQRCEQAAVLWVQLARAVCKLNGAGRRLECPEGELVPPRPSKAMMANRSLYASMFNLHASANEHGVATLLVIPEEHWSGSGKFLEDPANHSSETFEYLRDWVTCAQASVPGVIGMNLIVNVLYYFYRPLAIGDDAAARWGMWAGFQAMSIAFMLANPDTLAGFVVDAPTSLAPDRAKVLHALTHEGKNIALQLPQMTIFGPEKIRPVVEAFAARNPPPTDDKAEVQAQQEL